MTEEMRRAWKLIHIIELARFYCDALDNPSGGNLHIVLADGNTRNSDLEFCRDEARKARDHVGVALAELLLELSEEERNEVYVALLPPGHPEREDAGGSIEDRIEVVLDSFGLMDADVGGKTLADVAHSIVEAIATRGAKPAPGTD